MGGGKGGSASDAGVVAAEISAQEADKMYQLGEQQLQWAKDVWNQEQPLVNQSEQMALALSGADLASLEQMQQFSKEQQQMWEQYYAPLDKQYVAQAETWASPQNIAQVTGQAQASIAEQAQAGINTAYEQLGAYGVNPGAGRWAGLGIGANVLSGAAQAAAGTTAGQNMKLQQLALEQGAINTGQGVANTAGQMTNAATGAGQAGAGAASSAANTAQANLATGSAALTAPATMMNAGTNAMNTYVNAVDSYNNTQLGYAQLGAQEAAGMGSFVGGILGDVTGMFHFGVKKGGPIYRFQDGGMAPMGIPPQGQMSPPPQQTPPQQTPPQQTPPQNVPAQGTPGGTVPHHLSPSGGQQEDDVDAKLTAGEFVVPKDVAMWTGQKSLVTQIDKARQEMMMFNNRTDIGGEPVQGIPNDNPGFVSRPGMQQAIQPMPPQMLARQGSPPAPGSINQTSGIPMPA